MTTEEKLKPLMDEIDSYKKKIFDFDREENDFIPGILYNNSMWSFWYLSNAK